MLAGNVVKHIYVQIHKLPFITCLCLSHDNAQKNMAKTDDDQNLKVQIKENCRHEWVRFVLLSELALFLPKAIPIYLLVLRAQEVGNEPFWNKKKSLQMLPFLF